MARNPNKSLPNENTLYLGRSGSGKSQALKQNKKIPSRGVRLILYDPNLDHRAAQYADKGAFGRALLAGIRSGRGFRIAYTGGCCEKDHEWWCAICLSVLDGDYITYLIDEELGGSGQRTGAAAPYHAKLLNQGRKYGMIYHGVIQFAQELPKTVYRNCEIKYVGKLDTGASKLMSVEIDVPWQEIKNQKALQFWVSDPAQGFDAKQIQLKYSDC